MNAIRILSTQPWVGRLGWTLVHFLWQGLAIAGLYAAVRIAAKHSSPHRRYLLACAALGAMLAAPIATYRLSSSPEPVAPLLRLAAAESAPNSDSGTTFALATGENAAVPVLWPERVLPVVVMLWFAGTLVFWVRLAGGWMAAFRLRTHLARTAPREWQQAIDRLKTRLHVARPVRLLVSGLVEAPAVVGWVRPVVLVPIGAIAGLPAEHLEALLLHELAHIRRHDYLVNMVQSIAEALLFYHPVVWWISGHLRAERELCCDDLAVAATGDVFAYATALADLEACRPAHAHSALAANGGSLTDRIARLLGQSQPETRTFSAPGAVSVLLLAITACVVFGQAADRLKFEVASVKPTESKTRNSAGIRPLPGGHLHADNATVSMLMRTAYHLQDFQIVGGPEWIHDMGFDIEAKGEANATREQIFVMLQPLLEERFQLKYHRETRELPIYALTVARGGAKLPAPKEGDCVKADGAAPPAGTRPTPCGGLNILMAPLGMRSRGGDVPMSELIRTLSMIVGRPVLDRTGVTTRFDVDLSFTPDDTAEGLAMAYGSVAGHRETLAASAAAAANDPKAPPNLLVALQEQLGLKLESAKGPAEVMVIDHVEKPSAN